MRSPTATEILKQANNSSVRHALDRLLHKLRRFARAYPRLQADEMPDHDIVFVTGIGGGEGPDAEIVNAMKSTPALWLDAVPDDVVILPRKFAENLCPDNSTLEYMEDRARHHIEGEGARRLHEETYGKY